MYVKISKLLIKVAKSKFKIGKNVNIKFVKDRPGHDLKYAINSHKIRKELKWRPLNNINEGLKKTIKWYIDNRYWWQAILDKTYSHQRLGVVEK